MLRFRNTLFIVLLLAPLVAGAQARVTGRVEIKHSAHEKGNKSDSNVVVALVPTGNVPVPSALKHYRLSQKDKSFEKHLLAIPAGSVVDFPNFDPVFHNVFSLFEGQRFDLGLYETGTSRSVKFAKPGVSYIFCNIHPEMEAIIVAVPTSWYAVSAKDGAFTIDNVPPGRYELRVWYERATPEDLARLTRTVTVDSDVALNPMTIQELPQVTTPHKNKYGRDYDVTSPDSPYLPGQ